MGQARQHNNSIFYIHVRRQTIFLGENLSNHADMAGYVAQNLNQREQKFRERRECGGG